MAKVSDDLRTRTAQGFFWSLMGNGAQQFVTLIIGVCLARILAIEDYALVAMLSVFGIIAGNLQESGFTSALAVRKDVAHKDYNAVFWFSLSVSVAVYALLFCLTPLIAEFNHSPRLVPLGRILFLGFVISSFGTAHTAYLFRNLMVKQKTTSQVVASVASGFVGLGIALMGGGCWSLVAMDLCYKLCYTIMVWHFSRWCPSFKIDLRPAFNMLGFSCKLLFTNIITTLNNQLLQSVLGHYLPAKSVGHYSQANKWNSLGCNLLAGAVSGVAQPVLASVQDDEERQLRVFRKMVRFTSLLAFPCMYGLALISPEFIPILIGDKWLPCVDYLQILAVGGAIIPINNVYSNLLISRKRSGRYMFSTCSFLVFQMAWILFSVKRGMLLLLIGIVVLTSLWLVVWHVFVAAEIGLKFKHTIRDILPYFLMAVFAIYLSSVCASLIAAPMALVLVLKIVVAVPVYCFGLFVLKSDVFFDCINFAKMKLHL